MKKFTGFAAYMNTLTGGPGCHTLKVLCQANPKFDTVTSCDCNGKAFPGTTHEDEGGYCKKWAGKQKEWCFVEQDVTCGEMDKMNDGQWFSTGPCTDQIESRSNLITDAINLRVLTNYVGALVGTSLIAAAAIAIWFTSVKPGKCPEYDPGRVQQSTRKVRFRV
eukprot:gnl/TRDRNA2_/TRDRNA2_176176_c4_seq3.p1 gnl/TRDRNA2_/TRDRNA2_176176_c4~~gnl/TRDRNA2_/TRDRNA2_176176_c4_seq3.p1  ORF type:complete len:164 (-),score=22.32 gnl/TRDRNA2_/TRDRNA2_176176_c4_seq3:95-586(-)